MITGLLGLMERGLTLDEARNELALLASGIYGKPIANQNGAPIRLVVPWKTPRRTLLVLDGLEPLQNPPGPQEGRLFVDPVSAPRLWWRYLRFKFHWALMQS